MYPRRTVCKETRSQTNAGWTRIQYNEQRLNLSDISFGFNTKFSDLYYQFMLYGSSNKLSSNKLREYSHIFYGQRRSAKVAKIILSVV